jgi:toxin CptA
VAKLTKSTFAINASRLLAIFILLGHSIAIGALMFVPIPKVAFYFLEIVLILSATYYWLRDAKLILPGSWIALRLEDDCIVLFNRNGSEFTGKLLASSFITPHLVILQVSLPDYRLKQNVVLMADSMDAESFRKLRVAVKWGFLPTALNQSDQEW